MTPTRENELFVQLLVQAQKPLRGYIRTLLPRREAADDVLQAANLAICRKADEFQAGTHFTTWACRVAYFEVRAYLTRRKRDRHLFDDDLLNAIAARADIKISELDDRYDALRACLDKLSPSARELVEARYTEGFSVQAAAARLNKTSNAVSRALYRIRNLLDECIRKSLDRTELR